MRDAEATKQGSIEGGVTCKYQFTRQYEVDSGRDIIAQYEVEDTVNITEAGIEDVDGNLLAYATFPPVSMNDSRFHLSLQWLILKDSFV